MSNADIVNGWYNSVQFRNSPPEELTKFVTELNSGVPTVTVQTEILKTSYTVNVVNDIIREYQAAFVRVPDQAGESYWVNKLGSGEVSLTSISETFANTSEFNQIYHANASTPINATLVGEFYNNVLQRAATPADVAYWTSGGFNAAQMLQALVLSPEMTGKAAPYTVSYQFGEMAGTPQVSGSLIPETFVTEKQFNGIDSVSGGGAQVPDNGFAVGPKNIVSAVNSAIQWTDLNGQNSHQATFNEFFSTLTLPDGAQFTDPVVMYDSSAGRFVVIEDQIVYGALGPLAKDSHILVAVSKDADPNHGWYFQSIDTTYTVNQQPTWADYPMVSVDQSNIYISTNQYNSGQQGEDGPFAASMLTVLNKEYLYAGGLSGVSKPIQLASSPTSVSNFVAADPLGGAFVLNHTGDYINVAKVNNTTLNPFSSLYLGPIDTGPIINAIQPGANSPRLDAGDGRVVSAAANNGHLYAVFEVQPSSGSAEVHWVDLNVTDPLHPQVAAQGNILGSTIAPDATTFNPSIAVDKAGDVLIAFNASSSSLKPNDYYIVHKATDSLGAFSAPTLYQESASPYTVVDTTKGYARWGDYASAVADPNHAAGFWTSSEFASSASTWGTSIAQVLGLETIA